MEKLNYITSLVHQVKKNDVVAMRTLYELFSKDMLAISFRMTNDLPEAEDIIQEAFLKSFQNIQQLKIAGKYRSWLRQIVVNKSLAYLKKKVKFQDLQAIENLPEDQDKTSWYEGISFEKIKSAIQELPEGSRQVFSLFLLEDYKHREIAEMLGISISTSKSQYRYALKLLKEELSTY